MENEKETPIPIQVTLALIQADIARIKSDVSEMKHTVNDQLQMFLTKSEFEAKFNPVRTLAYGLAGLLLTAVVGAIVANVLPKV